MDNLVERLKAVAAHIAYDTCTDVDFKTLDNAIAALTGPTSEEVQHAIEWLAEYRGEDAQQCVDLIERLARENKIAEQQHTNDVLYYSELEKTNADQEQRIKELEAEVNAAEFAQHGDPEQVSYPDRIRVMGEE